MKPVLVLLVLTLVACAGRARPTVSGAELYAQVGTLRETGTATVGPTVVRRDQVLITGREGQVFQVHEIIEHCRGGDPAADVDCTLTLLRDQRFEVLDEAPAARSPAADRERRIRVPDRVQILIVGALLATPLVYGVARCEFEGCEAVFGVPLVLVAGGMMFGLVGP